ncbi:MAG: type II secretion system ATPase GspE [Porticoccus sp.]|nr:type II secretion system ATPase GspE [Porticoccus sp.]
MENRLPYAFAKRHQILLSQLSGVDTLQYSPKAQTPGLVEAQRVANSNVNFQPLNQTAFDEALTQLYQNQAHSAESLAADIGDDINLASLADALPQTEDLMEQEDEAPIIRLINAMLTEAIKQNASDIHIETFETRMLIRFRVDGVLREVLQPNRALAPLLISRIKVMAKLDIAEKRVPQDGRISLRVAGHEVDVRVSTMPSNDNERVVLRLLDKQAGRLDTSALGMRDTDCDRLDDLLHRPHGIILVTGPTGSGKTTTLYAGLQRIQTGSTNILTIEDPVEYDLEGIGQTQVNLKAGMTFAKGLRAILRQDPDVVMVGEIRDLETAQIAIQASLTGHLVLSTLHTNTAIGSITRLKDMGVEPFLLASSIVGVLAQRLVRVLCEDCKQQHSPTDKERQLLGLTSDSSTLIYRPNGCEHCNNLGYRGRCGIYELVAINDSLRALIHDHASEALLNDKAREHSGSIFDDGKQQVLSGKTSLEEVLRVTQEV